MIDKIIRNFSPPIIFKLANFIKYKLINYRNLTLFDGDDSMFKTHVKDLRAYGEYGCGASTIWVANNSMAQIYSTDINKNWIDHVYKNISQSDRIEVHHANLGKVGEWGRPLSYEKRDSFESYTNWIWEQVQKPDLVLIDGRFRVCCFFTSLVNAREGTKLIFDDYMDRPQYHVIEEILPVTQSCGRQAMFVVSNKNNLDLDKINNLITSFRYVMD